MASLETLNAANDSLHKIENADEFEGLLGKNIILKSLDLRKNGLQEVPVNFFKKNILLEDINLSWNRLQTLKMNLDTCSNLKKISLAFNSIKFIDQSVLIHLDSIDKQTNSRIAVSVYGNAMTCSCENIEFLSRIQSTAVSIEKEKLVCDTDFWKNKNYPFQCSEITTKLSRKEEQAPLQRTTIFLQVLAEVLDQLYSL